MITYLRDEEKKKCRELWEEAFSEDSASFVDYYFDKVVTYNRILAMLEKDRVYSMVHLNPYDVRVRDCVWRAEYLVGVATAGDYRHRGYMGRLIRRALSDLRAEGMPFCFLMPAREGLYEPYGFAFIARAQEWVIVREKDLDRVQVPVQSGMENPAVASWLTKWLSEQFEVYALRTPEYLHRQQQEIASERGDIAMLLHDGEPVGLESTWGLQVREQRFCYVEEPYGTKMPIEKPLMMGRILDVEKFVKVIRRKDGNGEIEFPIRIIDSVLPQNDGSWLWHLNEKDSRLERASWLEKAIRQDKKESGEIALTIEEFTSWLFGYSIPEAVRPYADVVDTLRSVFFDEVV